MTRRIGGRAQTIFIDTHALVAVLYADDRHHAEATAEFQSIAAQRTASVTSDWVLAEFLCVASHRDARTNAAKIVSRLRVSDLTTIVEASRPDWERAFELFKARRDKDWSFVDCTSITLCRNLGIEQVLTHDRHFVQAGLRVLL